MNTFVCPNCAENIAGYTGDVTVIPTFDDAVRSFNYWDVSVDLEEDMPYFPSEFFSDNPAVSTDYFPSISAAITCPFCEETFTVELKNDNFDEIKRSDRGIGGSKKQEIFTGSELRGKAGTYDFDELHIETGGEYRGTTTFDFTNIASANDLKKTMEDAALGGFHWFQSQEAPELSGSIYGSQRESNLYKEDVGAYIGDACYLAKNNRLRECCEVFFNVRENMKDVTRADIDDALDRLGENHLGDFIIKYFANDKKQYGSKIISLFDF